MTAPRSAAAELWLGRGLCLGAAILWSTAGLFIKRLTDPAGAGWSGWQVAGMRSLIAGVALLLLARLCARRPAEADAAGTPPRSLLPTRQNWVLGLIYGPTLLTYVLAQTYTTTANAIFLQYTAPLYILALSAWLLREKPGLGDVLTLPALLAGIGLILSAELSFKDGAFGNAMALVSGVGYALVIMLLRKWRAQDTLVGMAVGNFLLAAAGIAVACGTPQGFVWPDAVAWAQILWLGVFQIGLAYFLFQAAVRRITAVEASLLSLIEPVLCPLWAWLFVADRPPFASIIGGAVILAGLVVHTLWKAQMEKRNGTR
jgi:drug/metabolite transporter (DMT)-like permease